MNLIRFYRRYEEDGSCKVICTQCFATLGVAQGQAAIAELEARHICSSGAAQNRIADAASRSAFHKVARSSWFGAAGLRPDASRSSSVGDLMILVPLAALLLYGLPTLIELVAAAHLSPWLAVILPGDALGCAVLIAGFRKARAGLLLYLLLTGCEACLYKTRSVAPPQLAWIADLIPTLVVIGMLLRFRVAGRGRDAAPV